MTEKHHNQDNSQVIQHIKQNVKLLDYVSGFMQLKKSGSVYTAFCPFHENHKTPAFCLWDNTNTWKCFGTCNEGGDIFSFVMKKNGYTFTEALEHLAQYAGVKMDSQHTQQNENKTLVLNINKLAQAFFTDQLQKSRIALDYLESRKITKETAQTFGIGYSPKQWNALTNHLQNQKFTLAQIHSAGLASKSENGKYFDFFRDRIIFPIIDKNKNIVAFGGRTLEKTTETPKYINTKDTIIFQKSDNLFGIPQAKNVIRENNTVIIAEGYLDVITAHQNSIKNIVATLGTAINSETVARLFDNGDKRIKTIILCMDGDKAGKNAIEKTVNDIGTLKANEQNGVNVKIALLPKSNDPDQFIKENGKMAFDEIIANSKNIFSYIISLYSENAKTAVEKQVAVQKIAPFLNILQQNNEIELAHHVAELAQRLDVPKESIAKLIANASPNAKNLQLPQPQNDCQTKPANAKNNLEYILLSKLAYIPEALPNIRRMFRENRIAPIDFSDFHNETLQNIFSIISNALTQDKLSISDYINTAIAENFTRFHASTKQHESLDPNDKKNINSIIEISLLLRKRNVEEWLRELRRVMSEGEHTEFDVLKEFNLQSQELAKIIKLSKINFI